MLKILCLVFIFFNFLLIQSEPDYKRVLYDINHNKLKLKEAYLLKETNLDSVSKYFLESLVDKIIPHWHGRDWSFEGHTNNPNQGEIACGYFISTTLKHVGLNLNRYKLAQKSPYDEALSISIGGKIVTYEGESSDEIISELYCTTKQGIYFIGFDKNHVGYLLNEDNLIFIIHSNYLSPSAVIKESIENSEAFNSYSKFYLTPIS